MIDRSSSNGNLICFQHQLLLTAIVIGNYILIKKNEEQENVSQSTVGMSLTREDTLEHIPTTYKLY